MVRRKTIVSTWLSAKRFRVITLADLAPDAEESIIRAAGDSRRTNARSGTS